MGDKLLCKKAGKEIKIKFSNKHWKRVKTALTGHVNAGKVINN